MIYVITDPEAEISVFDQALAAARGGAWGVQLRDKSASDAALLAQAQALLPDLRAMGVKLFINDRVEVARISGADGLHIGQSDGDAGEIGARLTPQALGLSIESLDQMAHVPDAAAYLGAGPIRATATKPDHAQPIGFAGLAAIVARARVPVFAIGGLGLADVEAVKAAGAQGMAVVSAVTRSPDPQAATEALVARWRQ